METFWLYTLTVIVFGMIVLSYHKKLREHKRSLRDWRQRSMDLNASLLKSQRFMDVINE